MMEEDWHGNDFSGKILSTFKIITMSGIVVINMNLNPGGRPQSETISSVSIWMGTL